MPKTTRIHAMPCLAFAACVLVLTAFAPSARGQYAFTPLYEFSQDGQDGTSPQGTLVADASGNLFGTTLGGGANNAGTVFELVNNSGSYTLQTLYTFTGGSDGGTLYGGPAIDASGNLYGVAQLGGAHNAGTAWELKNNAGSYAFVLLATFNGGINGEKPMGTLALDSGGNLYGTTLYGGSGTALVSLGDGTVFELVNNGDGTYALNTLYRFNIGGTVGGNPYAGVVSDANGNLFGTTAVGSGLSSGTVFELANNGGGAYTFSTLYSFLFFPIGDGIRPRATVTLDANGNLFGTTTGGGLGNRGTVFELVNTSGTYTENILYSFNPLSSDGGVPSAPVLIDSQGNLFGTTKVGGSSDCGTVYELVNTSGTYTEEVLYNFTGGSDGCNPLYGGLYMDSSVNLFGASTTGGSSSNQGGALWELLVPIKTSLNLTSSANPIFAGDSAIFTASISAPASTPIAGTVTFSEGSTVLGTVAVSNQAASITVSSDTLGVGPDTITAQFISGVNTVLGSSGSMTETVYPNSDVALINGGNTFNGNQIVNGSLSATSFVGNGAGLTNVVAAGLACLGCITNAQLGINYAGSNTQGGDALNALALGGMPSTAFAVIGSNSFTGDQIVNGKITATGALSGTSASFTGGVSSAGLALAPSGTATSSQAFKSGPLDASSSLYNSNAGAAQSMLFRWQAEPVAATNNTAAPAATLNLLYGPAGSPVETGLKVNADGTLDFAPGQTIPGNISESQVTNLTNDLTNNLNAAESYATKAAANAQTQAEVFANNTFVPLAGGTMTGALHLPSLNATGAVTSASVSSPTVTATSTLTIGGGTAIKEYLSVAQSMTLPAVKSNKCATLQTASLAGFTPGTADTFALGLPANFQSNLNAGKVFLSFQVWETSSSPGTTLTFQICNPTSTNYPAAGTTGTMRIDVFKH